MTPHPKEAGHGIDNNPFLCNRNGQCRNIPRCPFLYIAGLSRHDLVYGLPLHRVARSFISRGCHIMTLRQIKRASQPDLLALFKRLFGVVRLYYENRMVSASSGKMSPASPPYSSKQRSALKQQTSLTRPPTVSISLGYSPFSTKPPMTLQSMRRKYSWRA